MAVADASYKFIYIDVGAYGSEGDSTVFRSSEFGKALALGSLNLPDNARINGVKLPFFFVADDAFPLHSRIMKPYVPKRGCTLTDKERIFNYRYIFLKLLHIVSELIGLFTFF